MVTGIIVTHGNLAEELLKTAKTIFGDFDGCYPVSNSQKSPQILTRDIENILDSLKSDSPVILFVDFWGGSCCHTCLKVNRRHRDTRLITGVNLPMLLAFLYKREKVPIDALVDDLVDRGRDSVRVLDAESL